MSLMGKLPDIFNQHCQVKTTPYEKRQEGLDIPSYRIDYGARSVNEVGTKFWNRLEKDMDK